MYEMGNGNEMNKNVTYSNWGTCEDVPLPLPEGNIVKGNQAMGR